MQLIGIIGKRALRVVSYSLIVITKQGTIATAKEFPKVVLHSFSTGSQLAETDRPEGTQFMTCPFRFMLQEISNYVTYWI